MTTPTFDTTPDRADLIAVVSPYHLSTREAPALAALQLADLFREGVLASAFAGDDAADDAREACARVDSEPWLSPLRPLVRPDLFDDDRTYLSAVAFDVLRGGPDPALSIPLAAGLDAFAARHGLVVARADATSVAQKAETRLARELCRFAVPALVQASADRLLLARTLFDDALADLRAAVADLASGAFADVPAAARAYAKTFADEREDLLAPPGPHDDLDEVRPVEGTVSIRLVELPADAVFASSVRAAAVFDEPRAGAADPDPDTLSTEPVVSMVIKVLGRR